MSGRTNPTPKPSTPIDADTHIHFLVDRSGSMQHLVDDVIGGFNGFIDEQRTTPGDCRLTLVQFDSNNPFEMLHDAIPIGDVPELDRARYQPRGATPLLDALGSLLDLAERRHVASTDELLVVFTDGLENASTT